MAPPASARQRGRYDQTRARTVNSARSPLPTLVHLLRWLTLASIIVRPCSAQRDYCMWDSIAVYLPLNQTTGTTVDGYGPTPYGKCLSTC